MARYRILLSAYFCMHGRGSEFAVGRYKRQDNPAASLVL